MANPIVTETTDDGYERSKLRLSRLEPGEGVSLRLKRVSLPRDSEYGPYIFAEVVTEEGEEHRVIVSTNMDAPGFVDPESETEFGEACKENLGSYPDRPHNGRTLADCFYEAPVDHPDTELIHFVDEDEDGEEGEGFSTYWFGVPDSSHEEDSEGPGPSIEWRD